MAIPLGRAHVLASTAIREARSSGIRMEALTPVGDLRRFEPAVESVNLLVVSADATLRSVLTALSRLPALIMYEKSYYPSITLFIVLVGVTSYLTAPAT